jgi:outer membrane protein assembly factor BamB
MKYLQLSILFTICIFSVNAQTSQVIITDQIAGTDCLTQNGIHARGYVFTDKVEDYSVAPGTKGIFVQLRNVNDRKGSVMVFDPQDGSVKWNKKISYNQGKVIQAGDVIIHNYKNLSYRLDYGTGKQMWTGESIISIIDTIAGVGLGYMIDSKSGIPYILQLYDLSDGHIIWFRGIKRDFGWNDWFHLNDSVVMIVSSGLHTVNMKTGKGWDYDAVTGKLIYTKAILTDIAGTVLMAATGTGFLYAGHDVISDLVSNTIIDHTGIFFASKENIARLKEDGQVLWNTPLQKEMTSKSLIFKNDSQVYLVNQGFAFRDERLVYFGTPFFASYDINTGKQVFMVSIGDKKDPVYDYKAEKDTILFLYKDRIEKRSMNDGALFCDRRFEPDSISSMTRFAGENDYVKTDSLFRCMTLSDRTKYHILTGSGKILVTNKKLEVQEIIKPDHVFFKYLSAGNHIFLSDGRKTILTDGENRAVAVIDMSGKSRLSGTRLYDIINGILFETDLTNFLQNTSR